MRFITVIGQSWRIKWKQAARASLTIVMLSAVAVVGLTLLGSRVFAAWKTPGYAERELSSDGAFENLLNFEAPDATVARREIQKEEYEKGIKSASNGMRVKNWMFTAETISFVQQMAEYSALNPNQPFNLQSIANQAQQVYSFGLAVVALDAFVDLGRSPPFTSFVDRLLATYYYAIQGWLTTYDTLVNSAGLNFLAKPPLPPLPSPATPYF